MENFKPEQHQRLSIHLPLKLLLAAEDSFGVGQNLLTRIIADWPSNWIHWQ